LLGLVSYGPFVNDSENDNLSLKYLEHVERAVSILGIDNVGVSSDDMTFAKKLFDEDFGIMVFDYSEIKSELRELLSKKFNSEEIDKIMYKNTYNKLFGEV